MPQHAAASQNFLGDRWCLPRRRGVPAKPPSPPSNTSLGTGSAATERDPVRLICSAAVLFCPDTPPCIACLIDPLYSHFRDTNDSVFEVCGPNSYSTCSAEWRRAGSAGCGN